MSFKVKDIYEFQRFSSITNFVEYCDEDLENARNSTSTSHGKSFHPCSTYEEASDLIRNGWPEGVRDMQKSIAIVSDGLDIFESNHPEMDVVGPIAVTGAFCSGDPECMMVPSEPDLNPVINIVFDIAVNCDMNYRQLLNRGAAILGLAAKLEASGKRVGIYATALTNMRGAGKKGPPLHMFFVCLKEPRHDFNIHSLSYAMANVEMYRRHGFRVFERSEDTPSGYGRGHATSLKDVEGINAALVDVDIYFEGAGDVSNRIGSTDKAIEYVLEVAKESGVVNF